MVKPRPDSGGSPPPRGVETFDTTRPPKEKAAHRKVLAGAAGGSVGTNLSVIIAFHFPSMPSTVTAAYSGLIIVALTFLSSYLAKGE